MFLRGSTYFVACHDQGVCRSNVEQGIASMVVGQLYMNIEALYTLSLILCVLLGTVLYLVWAVLL